MAARGTGECASVAAIRYWGEGGSCCFNSVLQLRGDACFGCSSVAALYRPGSRPCRQLGWTGRGERGRGGDWCSWARVSLAVCAAAQPVPPARLRQGFEYNMRFVYAHFPINVAVTGNKNKIEIRNFLGEKIVRTVDAYPGVTATRSADIKDEIVVVGNDIDNVSKTWYATARTAHGDGHANLPTGRLGWTDPDGARSRRKHGARACGHAPRALLLHLATPTSCREASRSHAVRRDARWQCSGPADLRG